jgi:hypothetical protein
MRPSYSHAWRTLPMPDPMRFRLCRVMPCAGNGQPRGCTVPGPSSTRGSRERPMVLPTRWTPFRALVTPPLPASVLVVGGRSRGAGKLMPRRRPGECDAFRWAVSPAQPPVRNGLDELRPGGAADSDWVLVHDAARCLVRPELIEAPDRACAERRCRGRPAGAPAGRHAESASADSRVSQTLPRGRQVAGADTADVPHGHAARRAGTRGRCGDGRGRRHRGDRS